MYTQCFASVMGKVNTGSGGRENVGTFTKDYLTTRNFYCPLHRGFDWVGEIKTRLPRPVTVRWPAHNDMLQRPDYVATT